jgi:hypothetical protein
MILLVVFPRFPEPVPIHETLEADIFFVREAQVVREGRRW